MRLSVELAMPPGSQHIYVLARGVPEYETARWHWLVEGPAKYLAWVDDDDVVAPNAITKCVEALEATGAALAFTSEQWIDEAGDVIAPALVDDEITLMDVALHPRAIHHLSVFRTSVFADAPDLREYACAVGIDWLCRAWAALRHSAVHVPICGYSWRHHEKGMLSTKTKELMRMAIWPLRQTTSAWLKHDQVIPRFAQ